MRYVAFNTYQDFDAIPAEAKPALFTTASIGLKLPNEGRIKYIADVEEEDDDSLTLTWSNDPKDGIPLFSKAQIQKYVDLLLSFAKQEGVSANKAMKSLYIVPNQIGYKNADD
ncbi:hypothetical protein [Lacticaseibacillus mingshuiensis]|uniref:hypothetical protein n=1 Tax=Lacticaseibacillus mingshuiensis TaxID=2799574 RepID=UPI001951C27B|nr:hypothetical protein [Lacticaseibacillus mingshuiensis]